MTPEVLWAMGRIGDYAVSPDHSKVVYNVTYFSVAENRSSSTLYIMNADGSDNRVLSDSDKSEYSPQWRPDGKKIGFLCPNDDGVMQLWEINPDGTGRQCVSNEADDINGFLYSPDCQMVLFTKEVKLKETVADLYPDLPLSSGRRIELISSFSATSSILFCRSLPINPIASKGMPIFSLAV